MREEIKQTEAKESGAAGTSMSLRVNIGLLDTLMNLAGELVLGRNQLLQGLSAANAKATELSSQRIDMITSELQKAIMRTRMQPIGHILNKLPPIVSDLAQTLEKTIDLTLEGTDVELDKTILETINDPLIHLIRNSADHGIETPAERSAKGKATCGKIAVKAFHEAGQVNISISDDGRGLDPEKLAASAISKGLIDEQAAGRMTIKQKMELIFMSGFSTADEITKISGHGIGMGVVTHNIENLGGVIELDSDPGKGTTILIKLPLTLAIIPSQITVVGNERYAIPQVNLSELLRIPAAEVKARIKRLGNAEVVRLRGELLPLLDLSKILGIEKKDHSRANVVNLAVVSAGVYKYCLVVDELQDSEEIVVKPLGRHLNQYSAYAGAAIMGDGKVALILDIANLGQIAELVTVNETVQPVLEQEKSMGAGNDRISLLTFKNTASEYLAMPLSLVERIERFKASDIETIGSEKVMKYRGGALPLFEMSQVCGFDPLPAREYQEVIVFKLKDKELGLMVSPPVDTIEAVLGLKDTALKQKGISGSIIIKERTTLLVDIFEMMEGLKPDWFAQDEFHRIKKA